MTQQLQELIDDYARARAALEVEFQARVTALAWNLAADALSGSIPVASIERRTPTPSRAPDMTKAKAGSKVERYAALLLSKEGKWVSRGSDRLYTCLRQTADGEGYEMKSEKDDKTVVVKFTTLVSRWNHIP